MSLIFLADIRRRVLQILPADSLRGRFARGAFWSVIGAVASQAASLAASILTARILGREPFGEFAIVQNSVGAFGAFAGMGLGMAATRYVAELRFTNPERAARIIALSAVASLATATAASVMLVVLAPWLAASALNAPLLAAELRIAAGVLFFNALNGAQTGVLAGFEAFRTLASVNLIRAALTLPLALAGVLLWGLRGAVAALVIASAVGWMLNHIAIRTECRRNRIAERWEGFWTERTILWQFSLPAFLGGAMTSPAMLVASSILVNQPRGYAEMGVFSAAYQWRTAIAFLPSLLLQPLLSMLSSVGTRDLGPFRKLLRANLFLSFGLSALSAIPIFACSSWIMRAYGRDFLAGKPVLILLVVATVISATAAVVGQAIAGLDRMWWGFGLNSVWALVLLGCASLLAPRYGALGLAAAVLAAYLVHAIMVAFYARVHLRDSRDPAPQLSLESAHDVAA